MSNVSKPAKIFKYLLLVTFTYLEIFEIFETMQYMKYDCRDYTDKIWNQYKDVYMYIYIGVI